VQLFNNTANNREGFVVRAKTESALTHSLSVRERVAFFCRLQLLVLMSKGFEKRTRFLNAACRLHLFNANTQPPLQINAAAFALLTQLKHTLPGRKLNLASALTSRYI
jgi:hypothetical protein